MNTITQTQTKNINAPTRLIPYPLCAFKLSIELNPFGFWIKPEFTHNKKLCEYERKCGEPIWWFRFAWFQVVYSRWMDASYFLPE